jgi:hypothetical protein
VWVSQVDLSWLALFFGYFLITCFFFNFTLHNLNHFFVFFLILFFNIELFGNWAPLFFFSIYFFVELSWSYEFSFFFSQFQFLTLYQLEIELHNFFYSLFMKLSWSYDPGREFNWLVWVNVGCFLVSFFNWFISILFFNIRLVENWGLWFFFIYFQ